MESFTRIERFFRNFGLSVFFTGLFLLLLEGASFLFIKTQGLDPYDYKYNQIVSGYHVFRNTPGARILGEVKADPSDPPTLIDENGFATNEPISLIKPDGVIRIFVMGGSAAFGIGQFPPFATVHPYHQGGLSYRLSPAGQLKQYLQNQRPDLKFEVINAAATDRLLHQSMIYYLETISRFSPDMIINLDGYNDLHYGMLSGRPYAEIDLRLNNYIDLLESTRSYKPYLMHLMSLGYDKFLRGSVNEALKKQFFFKDDMDSPKYSRAAYKQNEGYYIGSSQRFLQILDQYMAILKSEKVDFIFALQPMLYRQVNKQWSQIEDRMRRTVFGVGPNLPQTVIDQFILMSKYFFDEYMSSTSQERVEQNNFGFLDLNQEISHLKSDFELYVDYCHFTVEGSQAVGEILGRKVLERLSTQPARPG
ncbi:MAG: hypothetical protein HQL67_07110 [Magnetococcales bacterium]|nr:hypothetical protein [Magnetococcales bacterium]